MEISNRHGLDAIVRVESLLRVVAYPHMLRHSFEAAAWSPAPRVNPQSQLPEKITGVFSTFWE